MADRYIDPFRSRDDLQPLESLQSFADKFHCRLTVSERRGIHLWIPVSLAFVEQWLLENV